MKRTKKSFPALLKILSVIAILVSICFTAGTDKAFAAQEGYTIDGVWWGFEKATGTITWISYEWEGGAIPTEIEGVKVVALSDDWVCVNSDGKRDHVKEIILPEGLKRIGEGAFSNCKIESIQIPDSVEEIGDYAFRGCSSLTKIEAKGVKSVGEYCFRDCSALERVVLGKNLKSIGEGCFREDNNIDYLSIGGKEINYQYEIEKLGVKVGDYAFRNTYVLSKDFSPSYKTGKWFKALHDLKLDAGETGDYLSDIFKIAYSQKGYHEGNSFDEQHGNNTKGSKDFAEYNYWWGEPGTKWCGEFAGWVIAMASVPEEIYSSKYDTPEEDTYEWKNTSYAGGKYKIKKGDVILFYYDGGNHVILVDSVSASGNTVTVNSIDGNNGNGVGTDVYKINAKTGKTTNCWTDINGYVKEIYGPDWSKVKDIKYYTVKFDANGGKTGTKSKKLSNGAYYGVLPIPTYSGYDFDGWYTEKEGGKKITSYRTVSLDGNTTLYAHWSKNGKSVSGDDNTSAVTVKADKTKIKASKLKKKALTVKITIEGSFDSAKYENVTAESLKKYAAVSDDGKVKFEKGAKKGTYKFRVTVTDNSGNKTTKTLKIKVK